MGWRWGTCRRRILRSGLLFGAHPGSVVVRDDVDLTAPILEDEMDTERGAPRVVG